MSARKRMWVGFALTAALALWFKMGGVETRRAQLLAAQEAGGMKELKENLVIANKILDSEKLITPYGHVSARIPNSDRIFITNRKPPGLVTLDDVLVVDLDGNVVQGAGKTYSEIYMHTEIYKIRKDVSSIAHTHSEYAIALGMVGIPLQPTSNEGATFINKASIYGRIGLINTKATGAEVAKSLGGANALLLKGHGAVIVGPTLEETTMRAIFLEKAAKIQLLAHSVGKPSPYTAAEVDVIQADFRNSLATDPIPRPWLYYKSKVSEDRSKANER